MKLDKNISKQRQNRWLLTSAVALTLTTVGLSTNAHAATTAAGTDDASSQTVNGATQDKQVTLTSSDKNTPVDDKKVEEQSAQNNSNALPNNDSNDPANTDKSGSGSDDPDVVKKDAGDTTNDKKVTGSVDNADEKTDTTGETSKKSPLMSARMAPLADVATPTVDDLVPDKDFQQVVLFAIQQNNHPEVTDVSQITSDLIAELTSIDLSSSAATAKERTDQAFYNAVANAKSLAGLQYAKNLTKLVIYPDSTASNTWGNPSANGQLSDLSALQDLTGLKTLKLKYNQLTDADTAPLAGLTGLTTIDLSHNQLKDLSFMSKMTNLSNITLSYNDIEDVSPLRNITAAPGFFSFSNNHIYDITPLLGLNWQPFMDQISYMISANNQTWTTAPAVLNPDTKTLSTWSFAYDNLYNFNEFMLGDPQATGQSNTIGAGNWSVWNSLTSPSGTLVLDWDVSRHNDLTQPAAPNGLSFSGKIMVPYTTDASVGAVTVAFQLDGGVKIAPFVILSGKTGSSQDVLDDPSVQQAIADLEKRGFEYEKPAKYTTDLTATSESSSVTYDSDAQNITLLFSPLQKIYLVDENGNAIGDKVVKESGKKDTAWTVDVPTIDGYTFDHVDGGTVTDNTLSGTIQDVNNDIYVYYKSTGKPVTPVDPGTPVNPVNPVTNGTVTVHYQKADGTKVADDQTLTGEVGQSYTTSAPTIKGYKLVSSSANASGVYTAGNQDVYYTYAADSNKGGAAAVITPKTPSKPAQKGAQANKPNNGKTGSQANKGTVVSGAQAAKLSANTDHAQNVNLAAAKPATLPQTSDRQMSSWWGIALLAILGSLFGFKRSEKDGKKD
ncbi:MucBP domain-containing protein [Levilactobacillus tangyuanensis]|uniref:MucBP domain-containing protein n=1 Tax=Levilactobacillus tangyuanensis TaxID=2486021 RepID=A0ABW1TK01_9LACO|nr:MucBP domain-containing protein [Levilactobacillus tangyuanensis]